MVVRAGLEGSEGLLLKLVKLMMTLPTTSNYRYWITSCVHKWTQASGTDHIHLFFMARHDP